MKRKLITTLLLGTMVITLTGCGNKNKIEANEKNNIEISANDTSDELNTEINSNENANTEEAEDTSSENTSSENITIEEPNGSNNIEENDSKNSGKILYYEGFTGESYYLTKELSPNNKAKVLEIVEYLKELPPTDYLEDVRYQEFTPLPSNVEVNNVEVRDDLVTIDFNRNFVESLGSAAEKSVMESLVNTVGYNLNKSKVMITFNGENYSSGHIVMDDGEYFEVSNTTGIKLNKN